MNASSMVYKVLIPEVVAEEGIAHLKELGYAVKIGRGTDKATLMEDIQDCDAVIVRVAVIDRQIIENAPKLKVIAKHGAGYDSIDTKAAAEKNIRVVFAPNANSLSVAEQAIALMLACAKKIPFMAAQYKDGKYHAKDLYLNTELAGKTLGLIGLGRIGMHVARIAMHGFRMRVVAYDPFIPEDRDVAGVELIQNREDLLRMADFVSIHVPATPENVKSISRKEFQMMKPTAILINTARGTIVDQKALVEAVQSGQIAGAGLDVTDPEPASPTDPIFQLDRVIVTPHCSGATQEAMVRMVMDAILGIDEVFNGKEPTYKVV